MFGTREAFSVATCSDCGSRLLLDPPADPAAAYPPGYYSLGPIGHFEAPDNAKRRALRALSSALLRLPVPVADRVLERAPLAWMPFRWFAGRRVRTTSRILDVGSGTGFLVRRLALAGFRRLLGVDPHLEVEFSAESVTLRRAELGEVGGEFDVVMFHHVLEHLDDPPASLREARERLATAGTIVVRVPLADSLAARRYGADWCQLDVPRHLSVPTEAGVRRAAERAGLRVERAYRDSDPMQFWGSEQYRLGIPLTDPRSLANGGEGGPFSRAQLRAWGARTRALNRAGDGDSGCFALAVAD